MIGLTQCTRVVLTEIREGTVHPELKVGKVEYTGLNEFRTVDFWEDVEVVFCWLLFPPIRQSE